jgi:hypothetical protein
LRQDGGGSVVAVAETIGRICRDWFAFGRNGARIRHL